MFGLMFPLAKLSHPDNRFRILSASSTDVHVCQWTFFATKG
jgi:hypothetical protein